MKTALNFGIIVLIALAITVLPGGGPLLSVVLTLITILFFVTIAVLGYRMYREHRWSLDALEERDRLILYSSIGLAFLTFAATQRLFAEGAAGALIWIALLGLGSYGVFWVFMRSRRYD
ncbi:MAG: hypothetical protein QOJ07_2014 [Thermoleophilaceae bacterium]|jgi:hypothetical protein|nr:hypothetical protein [Thermoleophilaceae bacterium]